MSNVKGIILGLVLVLGATIVADAGPHHSRRRSHDIVYGHATPQGYQFVTPAGNIVTVPYSDPVVVAPSGGTWHVDTPHGSTSAPSRTGYEGTSPRCPRFFC
jgi:hypothetical protein